VNLAQLPDLHRLRDQCRNPRLRRYYDEAIRQTLAGIGDHRLPHRFLRALMWLLLVFFAVSGSIGILASVNLIRVDPPGLGLIWKTFVTSVVGLALATLRSALIRQGAGLTE
jgi:hypothetical protein